MKIWRPVIVLLAVAALSHYSFLLVRGVREWNLQRENQLLRQQVLAAGRLERELAVMRELSRKLGLALGARELPVPGDEAVAGLAPAGTRGMPLSMPVTGRVSRVYQRPGWPQGLDHPGLDLAGQPGEPVFAAAEGRVIFRDLTQRLGYMVLLDHGGGFTTGYGHLSMALPEVGERVRRGQLLGRLAPGTVGMGSHLHVSAQQDGIPVDPGHLLGGWTE